MIYVINDRFKEFNSPHLHQKLIFYIMFHSTLYNRLDCTSSLQFYYLKGSMPREGVFFLFSLNLKEVRKKKHMKQSDLAKELNTAQQVISDYEVGKKHQA